MDENKKHPKADFFKSCFFILRTWMRGSLRNLCQRKFVPLGFVYARYFYGSRQTQRKSRHTWLLRDYAAVKGEMSLKREMMTSPVYLNEYAFHYGGLSDRAKVRERKQWKNGISIKDIYKFDTARVSLPVFPCDIGIPDCVVYGFHFFRLGSESDYFEASNKLNNCLRFSRIAPTRPIITLSYVCLKAKS